MRPLLASAIMAATLPGCFLFHSPEEEAAADAGPVDAWLGPLPPLDCEDPTLWEREGEGELDVGAVIGTCGVDPSHPIWTASLSARSADFTREEWSELSPPTCWRVVEAEPGTGYVLGDTHRSEGPQSSMYVHGHRRAVILEGRTLLPGERLYVGRSQRVELEVPRRLFREVDGFVTVLMAWDPLLLTTRGLLESPGLGTETELLVGARGEVLAGALLHGRPAWLESVEGDLLLRVVDSTDTRRVELERRLGSAPRRVELHGDEERAVVVADDELILVALDGSDSVTRLPLEAEPDQTAYWSDVIVLRFGRRLSTLSLPGGEPLETTVGEVDRLLGRSYLAHRSLPAAAQIGNRIAALQIEDGALGIHDTDPVILADDELSLLGAPIHWGGDRHVWGEHGFLLNVRAAVGARARRTEEVYGGSTVFAEMLGSFRGDVFGIRQPSGTVDVYSAFSVGPCE